MSFNEDGYFDIDECLRARELANFKSNNMYMFVISKGVPDDQVRGERDLRAVYGGGGFSGLVDVHGYFFTGHRPQGNSKPRYRSMTIIKRTDIATPTLLHLLNENEDIQKVALSIFHHNQREIITPRWSSTSGWEKDVGFQRVNQPLISWFTIVLRQVKIKAMSTFTSKHSDIPLDIVSFDFRRYGMEIHRLTTDLNGRTSIKGGANQCTFEIGN